MPFRDLVNQDHAVLLLRTAVRSSRVSHAYLFVGPRGVGRHRTAIAFAQLLNCERADSDACGQCRACTLIASGQHPDVRVVDVAGGRVLDPEDTQQRRERVLELLERLEGADPLDRLDAAEEFSKDKDNLPELLEVALFWYRDILVWQQTGDDDRLINLDRRDRIAALAPTLPPALLNARIQAVEDAGDALERNVHPRLLLETLFLRIAPPTAPAPGRRS